MFRFNFIRSARDWMGNVILILLPIILIGFFYFVYSDEGAGLEGVGDSNQIATMLTISFALIFQIYGSAHSFETIGMDFLSPKRDRLLATPAEPRKMILSILMTSILVSFLQTMIVVLFSMLVLDATFPNFVWVALVLLISVVFNQLFGTIILFATQKVNTATAVTSLYGTVVPIISGMYFPMPDTPLFNFIGDYLTPLALANTAIEGAMSEEWDQLVTGVVPLLLIIGIFMALLNPLSKKVNV